MWMKWGKERASFITVTMVDFLLAIFLLTSCYNYLSPTSTPTALSAATAAAATTATLLPRMIQFNLINSYHFLS